MGESKTAAHASILEATFRTLALKGSASLTLRDVANEAGVALSQIHYYFGSKEGLLVAAAAHLVRSRVERLQEELGHALAGPERLGRAMRFLREHCSRGTDSFQKVYLDLMSMAAWSPELAGELRRLHEELLEVILAEAGRIGRPEIQTKGVARVVLAAVDGLALQALQGASGEEMDAAFGALEGILGLLLRKQEE